MKKWVLISQLLKQPDISITIYNSIANTRDYIQDEEDILRKKDIDYLIKKALEEAATAP